jgi:hypothetical protein
LALADQHAPALEVEGSGGHADLVAGGDNAPAACGARMVVAGEGGD